MNQTQHDPGWVGWKSIVLGFALLWFSNRFGLLGTNVAVQREEVKIVAESAASAAAVAVVQAAPSKDYFGGLSAETRNEMLANIKWETKDDYEITGDPKAKKGGSFRWVSQAYPPTLRTIGRNSSDANLTMIQGLVYEPLLGYNADPFYYYPGLANQWSVGEDKQTFYFSIDSEARWADNKPVRAQDVVATWDLLTDSGIEDPFNNDFWRRFERPVALNDSVVMMKAKGMGWQNFLYAASALFIFPEHVLRDLTGKEFLSRYNSKMILGSGPYELVQAEQPQRIIFGKRKNYWAEKKRFSTGMNNFDRLEFVFVKDEELTWEKFKAGEFDYLPINYARRWVEEMEFPASQNGWVQRHKVYNFKATGSQGFSFNIRKFPFDDINIRKAFAYLWNRDMMMDKLMFNEYAHIDSIFENSPYKGDKVPKIRYNPELAREALAASGWVNKNSQGYLEKDGKIIDVELAYIKGGGERFFTIFQEDLRNVGIKLSLKEVTWATNIKEVGERNFSLNYGAFVGQLFPNPESAYHSKFADQNDSGNRWGFKNSRVDEILEQYRVEFDASKRVHLLKEMDNIITNEYIWAFAWYSPAERLVYWNKFGMPDTVLTRTGDYRDVMRLWWYEPELAESLKQARANNSKLPRKPIEIRGFQ
ncbi:MAG: hypothetical protein H3C47_00220 [Candidatus Cloacimonetes bacterium]|nr:hypothetical protein [Candidatus Cloacimonadota bacterium]